MTLSIAGAIVAILVLAPNLLLLVAPPRDGIRTSDAGLVATILERAGQVGCLVLPALTGREGTLTGWVVPVAIAVGAYLALWGRYLRTRQFATLYAPLGALPVPMAVFPVLAFLSLGGWLDSIPTGIAALVLAAGHLPNSVATRRRLASSDA